MSENKEIINILPYKEGFREICVGDVLELQTDELSNATEMSDVTYYGLPTPNQNAFRYFITSDNTDSDTIHASFKTVLLTESCFLYNQGCVSLFNNNRGPIRINNDVFRYKVKADGILPEYLMILLHDPDTMDQYNTLGPNKRYDDGNAVFANTHVYIPDGDPVISLYEQMRIYNDLRQKEINKLLYATGASLDPGRSLASGTLLKDENIVISEHIDDGGFGKIYMATDLTAKGRPTVALKELFVKQYCNRRLFDVKVSVAEYLTDDYEHQKKKFRDEYNILAALNKRTSYVPAVDTKRGIIEANNTLYYILQYVSNDTLWHYCHQENIPQGKILGIVCQAGIALHHCHSINYLHLDVTPSNIMIDEQYNGVLIDFGNSKHYSVDSGSMTSVSREAAHTPRYTPPELQNQRQRLYYMQTDIYQLALTLYSTLTGCQPPERESMDNDDWYYGVLQDQLVKANVSGSIISAIFKAVSYRYEDRYPTVLDFLKALPLDDVGDSIRRDIYSLQPVASFSQVANNMPEIYEQESQIEESIL